MALIQPLNQTLNIIATVNAGNDATAASMLGMRSNNEGYIGSFLSRVIQQATTLSEVHNGGVLVTPDEKQIYNKSLVEIALKLPYTLTESVSVVAANSISSLSTLSENNINFNNVVLNEEQMTNIRDSILDGIHVMSDAVSSLYKNTVKINNVARNYFTLLLGESDSGYYANLMSNAITGASILYSINKIAEFSTNNIDTLSESMNTYNVVDRADDILFSTLNLEENLINSYIDMIKFNNNIISLFGNSTDASQLLEDATEYINMAINRVAIPIAEGSIPLNSNELVTAYNNSVTSIAALYDEYLQDYCAV